ncbi:MAG: YdcF family protein [Zoogloea sp.]|uniref:YdcF family protein n=1 Tax=Zoogloea sp. TaxID=49181 RepID=UPI00262C0F28|nr:YdcF family protein [Zoogloea sp.]MDD2987418.1 YdcF family protein [Zoogloea sp.]
MFILKKILASLILPPLGPLILIAAGLVLSIHRPRAGRILASLGLLAALALCTPTTVNLLLADLESAPPVNAEALAEADAIVILAGGRRSYAPEFDGETVNALSLERIRYGARLARQSKLPVMVTGGAPKGGTAEGELMKVSLEEDFGISVRWVESRSRDTRENAEYCAALMLPSGHRRIVLVTHAAHMRRSVEAFEAAGFSVVPAPTAHLLNRKADEGAIPSLPGMNSAYAGWYASHEWLGLLAYRLSR